MTGLTDILLVALVIGSALFYLGWKGYQRMTSRTAACGGCGSACGAEPASPDSATTTPQVVHSLELLTVVTREDRA